MKMLLSKNSSYAYQYFDDDAGAWCFIGEGIPTRGRPVMLLGVHHHLMVLSRYDAAQLYPQLLNFACTGQLLDARVEDFMI